MKTIIPLGGKNLHVGIKWLHNVTNVNINRRQIIQLMIRANSIPVGVRLKPQWEINQLQC